jgi:hypothetical protein
VGQADLSLGDGTLAPYPGLAATLADGEDFFDRPSGVVLPQFASSLSASLDGRSSDGTQNSQASADQGDAAPPPTTSSRDYDRFSDRVASSSPATSAYDQFSDAVTSAPQSIDGLFSDAVASSQVTPAASSDSSQTVASESPAPNAGGSSSDAVANSPLASSPYDQFSDAVGSAPRSVGGFFSDAVASSQVGPDTSGGSFGAAASDAVPRSVGGLFSDAVASSQVGAGAQSDPVLDPFGEVAASAPAGRAIGSFVDKVLPNGAIATLRPVLRGFGDYLSNSVDALAKGARDIPGYARDLVDNPVEFLRQAGPTFTGLGFSIPAVGVGPITGASALRGGSAAAEEISALAASSKALLSRGMAAAQDAGGLANEGQLAAEAAQGTATEGGVGTVDTFGAEEISAADAGATPPALRFMKKWDAEARTKAETKLANLGRLGGRRMPESPRPPRSAADIWRADGRAIPPGHDIDHVLDLQLGGSHTLDNMQPLPSSVNRSLGPQIAHRIKNLPIGTFIKKWTIGD